MTQVCSKLGKVSAYKRLDLESSNNAPMQLQAGRTSHNTAQE